MFSNHEHRLQVNKSNKIKLQLKGMNDTELIRLIRFLINLTEAQSVIDTEYYTSISR
jgi:hypothetical protein